MIGTGEVALLFIIIFGIVLLPLIFFLVSLMKTLQECDSKNRTMEPGLVWLNLIPIFSLGWMFYTVIKVWDALKAEFKSRNLQSNDPQFAYSIGLAYCITLACSIIPFIGFFTSISSFILWIIYWVKTHKYSTQLN